MGLIKKLKTIPKTIMLLTALPLLFVGCASKTEIKSIPDVKDRVYCTEEQRQAEVCMELYQPVCGYPEKKTYSNPCFACMDENVEYWVDGLCK